MKNAVKYMLILVALIILYVILLTSIAKIPRDLIKNHIYSDAIQMYEEGLYSEKRYLGKTIAYDNYTDAIMLNNAYSMDSNDPLYSALIIRRNYNPGITTRILSDEVGTPKIETDETENLVTIIEGRNLICKEYAKYWHGYLIYLKPLLVFFNYSTIKVIQCVLSIILTIILLILIKQHIGLSEAIIFLLGFLIVDIPLACLSLEFAPVFIIMLISSIILILTYKKNYDKKKYFFIIGSLTCFFDFLTAPIITLGIPLILLFLLKQKEKTSMDTKSIIKEFLKLCLAWFLGYTFTWISKFVLVDLLYHKNLIYKAIQQVLYRTIGSDDSINQFLNVTVIDNIKMNCNLNFIVFDIFCVFEFIILIYFIIKNRKNKIEKIRVNMILPYILASLLPICWYLILREHSVRHVAFTQRATLVFWIGMMLTINLIVKNITTNGPNKEK